MTDTPDSERSRPDVSVLIVSFNTAHLLDRLFETLSASQGSLAVQVIVVDNVSEDDSVAILGSRFSNVAVIKNERNVGFGRANNIALSRAQGRYVLLLNTDAFVSPETLTETVQYMDRHPEFGILGVRLVGEDGSVQPSCRYFPTPWNVFVNATGLWRLFRQTRLVDDPAWDPSVEAECDWVPGCYYLVRHKVIEQVGLFDPRFFLYYEEVDHCRRVKAAGWKVGYYPHTSVIHLGGQSAAAVGQVEASTRQLSRLQVESELLYFRKHYGIAGVLFSLLLTFAGQFISLAKGAIRGAARTSGQTAQSNLRSLMRALAATRLGGKSAR